MGCPRQLTEVLKPKTADVYKAANTSMCFQHAIYKTQRAIKKRKIIVKANCGRHEKYWRPRKLPEKKNQNYKSASHYSIDAQTWFT